MRVGAKGSTMTAINFLADGTVKVAERAESIEEPSRQNSKEAIESL